MRTKTTTVAMAVIVLALPFLARGQTPTVAVNPVAVAAGAGSSIAGGDLTDMFLASLRRTSVFSVIDARTGRDAAADFYLSARCNYREEQVEVEENDSSRSSSIEASRPSRIDSRSRSDSVTVKRSRTHVTFIHIDITVTDSSGEVFFSDFTERSGSAGTRAEQIVRYLADRLAKYVDIMGPRPRTKSVEARVVSVVDPTTAVVDKGNKAGLESGDELEVRRGDIITNAEGEVIFSRLENIGTAEVKEVQDEGALITVAAPLKLEEGDTVVRPAPAPPEPSVTEHVETGDALFEASFYKPAVREYLAALGSDPELLDVLFPLAVAQMKTGNHVAAFESFASFLDAGQPVELAATHRHAFSRDCEGTFTLTRESASYRSPREDDWDHWFDVSLEGVVDVRTGDIWTEENLVIRAPSAKQVEKNKDDSKNWTLIFDLRGENTEIARIVRQYILHSQGR